MCDAVSISNQMMQQNLIQQNIQHNIDMQNLFQQQNDWFNQQCMNNNRCIKPRIPVIAKLGDSIKAKFANKNNLQKDTVEFSSKPNKVIPGINAPGIHRDENGKIDGIIAGRTEDGNFITVNYGDERTGGRTPDGKMWDGIKVNPRPKKFIPGINAPGIHRDENGKIDGIIGGMTEDGNFITVSPADERTGGRTPDGKMWDGVKVA